MPTKKQSETSRLNGAKSRGPKTAAGKAISSRNAATHGLLSRTICIEGEDTARFAALLHSLRAELQPRNSIEDALIEDLAVCRWRQRRMLVMETACISQEIRRQDPQSAIQQPIIRAVQAFGALTADARTLDLISSHEQRFDRQYNRILRSLAAVRQLRKSASAQTNPTSDSND